MSSGRCRSDDDRLRSPCQDHPSYLQKCQRGAGRSFQHNCPHRRGSRGGGRAGDLRGRKDCGKGIASKICGDPEAYERDPAWCTNSTSADGTADEVGPMSEHALARLDPNGWRTADRHPERRDLHERAGAKRLLHMHGELTSGWCLAAMTFSWHGYDGEGRLARSASGGRSGPTSSGSGRCLTKWSGSIRR